MSKNEFQIQRTAFAHFTVPTTLSTTASTQTGAYVPSGAIVTGMRILAGGAVTVAQASNATLTPYVGAVALGTNNRVASACFVQTAVKSVSPAAADGVYVPTGGYVDIDFGSTGNSTQSSAIVADGDIYVDYLYCPDRDAS